MAPALRRSCCCCSISHFGTSGRSTTGLRPPATAEARVWRDWSASGGEWRRHDEDMSNKVIWRATREMDARLSSRGKRGTVFGRVFWRYFFGEGSCVFGECLIRAWEVKRSFRSRALAMHIWTRVALLSTRGPVCSSHCKCDKDDMLLEKEIFFCSSDEFCALHLQQSPEGHHASPNSEAPTCMQCMHITCACTCT